MLPSLQYSVYQVSFPEVKRPEPGLNQPLPSSAEVNERIQLYLYTLGLYDLLKGDIYLYHYLIMTAFSIGKNSF